ncbi:MAG: conjugative transposon protein TraM, partial [Tannerella sp.]|nr:conjugative transposon protein TraM [Tannerella sp.]
LVDNKLNAYEQEQAKQKQTERMRSLSDFSAMLGGDTQKPANDLLLPDEEPEATGTGGSAHNHAQSSIQNSARAYHDINRTLGSFYEQPREDPEKELLRQELEELRTRMDETEHRKSIEDNQMALMEKSFQMASKYMPSGETAGMTGTPGINATEEPADIRANGNAAGNASGKTATVPVVQVREKTVSVLYPEMSDAEFIEAYSKPRNMDFVTATAETALTLKNTISACVHGDQTVTGGQNVRLRLLEPLQAGRMVIPRNTVLSGTAKIQGERLEIMIHSLEHAATILPVGLTVYDLDGQRGIFIPDLQELNAAKEIVANMGTSAGTSINLSSDATKQFAADMGRNLLQGVSQFTAKKLREVKVHLKAGYRVYLLSEEQLKNNVLANSQ